MTTCAYCGVGCAFRAEVKGNTVVRMTPHKDGKANEGHACVKGRFAFGYATHRDRIAVDGDFEANGVPAPQLVPLVRARMTTINGENVTQMTFEDPQGERWARRDSNLSWAAELQADNRIVAGEIWGDASDWTRGDRFDGTMNYLLTGHIFRYVGGHRVVDDVVDVVGNKILVPYPGTPYFEEAVPVEIAGHADAQGSPERNLELSRRRAQAVLDYFVSQGEDPERFVAVGYGDTRPIADNSTAEGRQKNRRIEFIALEE